MLKQIFLFLILVSNCAYSQSWQIENVIPPEVFHFDIGAKSDVGSTGNLNISIPLLTVPGRGGLDFPVSLSYSAGIKTRQQASWVGLGWMLDLGSITRVVNMVPDYALATREYPGSIPANGLDSIDYPDYYQISIPNVLSSQMYQTETISRTPKFNLDNQTDWKIEFTTRQDTGLRTINDTSDSYDKDYYLNALTANMIIVDNNPYNGVNKNERSLIYTDIDKFILTSPSGIRYVFGQPLKSEIQLTYYTNSPDGNNKNFPITMEFNSNWRLTAILSPDFVDGGKDPLNPVDSNEVGCKGNWISIQYYYITNMRLTRYYNPNLLMQVTYPAAVYTPTHRLTFVTKQSYDVGYMCPEPNSPDKLGQYKTNSYEYITEFNDVANGISYSYLPQRLDSLKLERRYLYQLAKGYRFNYIEDPTDARLLARGTNIRSSLNKSNFPHTKLISSSQYANAVRPLGVGAPLICNGKLTLLSISPFDSAYHSEPGFKFEYHPFNPFYYITQDFQTTTDHEFTAGLPTDLKIESSYNPDYYRFRTDRFGFFYATETEFNDNQAYYLIDDEVRRTNGAVAYSIKKVSYPTGGYEEYEYEANKFDSNDKSASNWEITPTTTGLNEMLNSVYFGLDPDRECGIRLKKKIISDQGNPMTINYGYGSSSGGVNVGHLSCPPVSAWRRAPFKIFRIMDRGRNVVEYEYVDEMYSDGSRIRQTYYTPNDPFIYNKQKRFRSYYVSTDDDNFMDFLLIENSYDWKRNQLKSVEYFNASNQLVKKEVSNFEYPVTVNQNILVTEENEISHYINQNGGIVRKTSVGSTVLDQTGSNSVTKWTQFSYPAGSPQPSTITEYNDINSQYLKRITTIKYAEDLIGFPAFASMVNAYNMRRVPIEKTVYDNQVSPDKVKQSELTEWQIYNGYPKPFKLYKWSGAGNFTPASTSGSTLIKDTGYGLQAAINAYDNYGNVTQITDANGISGYMEWSSDYRYSRVTKTTQSGLFKIYRYDNPFYLPSMITDENGISSFIQYDGFGRLIRTIGPNGAILKENIYHFKP